MSKLAMIASIDVPSGNRDAVLRLLMAHRSRTLESEPGTLSFEVMAPREDDQKLLLFEVYQDDAAFEKHLSSPSIARFRHEATGLIGKISTTRCALVE